ncbi:hypothetical protein, unlikely [Trypanosoma brucei gambiense DAL972]|uniref:Uncharacterized protein n=1 Tax=Trypanosoma brucei gambiense (strain MHOM/CI/86/DAL972) TaxID=679716 RepID=C9ZSY8_TRYB9|nr:hypothetical protein, unlikely [Trypanosoma brucei gambiense DAL972]CBH12523.1 hypothetical protein, unlikely [Trypanosoma brucei gambiense DAL972]|eukprot:XP_011774803.1 hypothetical protein, unlikely [Trypanosoma brucei gambiense DAL972]
MIIAYEEVNEKMHVFFSKTKRKEEEENENEKGKRKRRRRRKRKERKKKKNLTYASARENAHNLLQCFTTMHVFFLFYTSTNFPLKFFFSEFLNCFCLCLPTSYFV